MALPSISISGASRVGSGHGQVPAGPTAQQLVFPTVPDATSRVWRKLCFPEAHLELDNTVYTTEGPCKDSGSYAKGDTDRAGTSARTTTKPHCPHAGHGLVDSRYRQQKLDVAASLQGTRTRRQHARLGENKWAGRGPARSERLLTRRYAER